MSTQIAVRLPAELVCYLDDQVAAGGASSRADLVARLLRRDLRRHRALADLEILKRHGVTEPYPDLVGIPDATAHAP